MYYLINWTDGTGSVIRATNDRVAEAIMTCLQDGTSTAPVLRELGGLPLLQEPTFAPLPEDQQLKYGGQQPLFDWGE